MFKDTGDGHTNYDVEEAKRTDSEPLPRWAIADRLMYTAGFINSLLALPDEHGRYGAALKVVVEDLNNLRLGVTRGEKIMFNGVEIPPLNMNAPVSFSPNCDMCGRFIYPGERIVGFTEGVRCFSCHLIEATGGEK